MPYGSIAFTKGPKVLTEYHPQGYLKLLCGLSHTFKPKSKNRFSTTEMVNAKDSKIRHLINRYLRENIFNSRLYSFNPRSKMLSVSFPEKLLYASRAAVESWVQSIARDHDEGKGYNAFGHLIDTRFSNIEVVNDPKYPFPNKDCEIEIVDVDVSMEYSIIHSFNLNPTGRKNYGQSPLSLDQIKDRFITHRKDRIKWIKASMRQGVNYSLYAQDFQGKFRLIAENRNQLFSTFEPLSEYLNSPSDQELDAIGKTILTDGLINSPLISNERREALSELRGLTFEEVLNEQQRIIKSVVQGKSVEQMIMLDVLLDLLPVFCDVEPASDWGDLHEASNFSWFLEYALAYWIFRPKKYLYNFGSEKLHSPVDKKLVFRVLDFITSDKAITPDTLGITKENARTVLMVCKIADITFGTRKSRLNSYKEYWNKEIFHERFQSYKNCKSTIAIRNRILKIQPALTTVEAFTNLLCIRRLENMNFLSNPLNWIDERALLWTKIMIRQQLLARSLSRHVKTPFLFATRGNSGLGKSWKVHEILQEPLTLNNQLIHGVLNPDRIKAVIKEMGSKVLLNRQVYLEGRIIFEKFLKAIVERSPEITSVVVDTRLLSIEDLIPLLTLSDSRGVKLEIADIEGSIWESIISILHRAPFGPDPCVDFDVIKKGYIDSKKNRQNFINLCKEKKVHYSLYRNRVLISELVNGEWVHKNQSGHEESLSGVSSEDIDAIGEREIDGELISNLHHEKKEILGLWRGHTIKEALERHSGGQLPKFSVPICF